MEINRCARCMEEVKGNVCSHCGLVKSDVKQEACGLKLFTILHGRYLTGYVLGQGGFGITYIGYDLSLDKKVAIKEYYPRHLCWRQEQHDNKVSWSILEDDRNREYERFLREAKRMAKFDEIPGIVRVRDTFSENDTAYIVMDYVDGITLKDELADHGTMTYRKCYELLLPIMESLEKVHRAGLIHRDISPDNIMVRKDGKVYLLDMGAAKDMALGGNISQVVVKDGFSPVEQYGVSGEIGTWSDVYALCATMYYCITGKLVSSERYEENGKLQWNGISSEKMPEKARNVLERGLAVMCRDRIQTVQELLEKLPEPTAADTGSGEEDNGQQRKDKGKENWRKKAAIIGTAAVLAISVPVLQRVFRPVTEPALGEESEKDSSPAQEEKETEKQPETGSGAQDFAGEETWTDSSGTKYTGQKVNGVIDGYGTAEYANGDVYKGEFKAGIICGSGVYSFAGGERYEGQWEGGKYNGEGTIYYKDGSSKTGIWKNNKYREKLSETYKEIWTSDKGIKYTGSKSDGVIDGYGMAEYPNGDYYEGEFEKGIRNGAGVFHWADGTCYGGGYKDGERSGYGVCYFAGGDTYEGEFKDGRRNGNGIYSYANGDRYEGEFKNGKYDGEGTMYYKDGTSKTGIWKEGVYQGETP